MAAVRSPVRVLAALGTAATLLVACGPGHAAPQGQVLLLFSAHSSSRVAASSAALRSGSGWLELGSFGARAVPAAPDTTVVLEAGVPAGSYGGVRVEGKQLIGQVQVAPGQLTPVLVAMAGGRPIGEGLYVGNQEVSLGLRELQGALPRMPAFQLLDQRGRPFTSASIAGHTALLTAFNLGCRTACPLYTGLFWQLARELPASVWLVEATTDPGDTPAALRRYAATIGARWTFATGDAAQLASLWRPFGLPVGGGDLTSSVLVVVDPHGYVRTVEHGIPDVAGALPPALLGQLDAAGRQALASHGDGWGAPQVVDAVQSIEGGVNPSAGTGGLAPTFTLPGLNGGSFSLSQFRGRPLVISFWASWCVPCRTEMPMIERTVAHYPSVVVLMVNERDSPGAARSFVDQVGVRSTVLLDESGSVGDAYLVTGLPTTVFVRVDGTIEDRYVGELTQATLVAHLQAIAP
jgi:cytochrome c biogenesis protein CcmG/thiol:disulfide interchange protein DsbE